MEKLDTYNVVPGLEFLADNPEFLTKKADLLAESYDAIYIPRAYVPKLLDLKIEHPDDERYPTLLNILGDVFELNVPGDKPSGDVFELNPAERSAADAPNDPAKSSAADSVERAVCPIFIHDVKPSTIDVLDLPYYDSRKHEYQSVGLAYQLKIQDAEKTAILTDDNGLRALALSAGLNVIREKPPTYTGRRMLALPDYSYEIGLDPNLDFRYDAWKKLFPNEPALRPNEFIVFTERHSNKSHVMRYDETRNRLVPCRALNYRAPILREITPRNIGQTLIMEALLAPVEDIPIVIIQGDFGTGKTFLTTAIAYAGVESRQYEEIVICPRDSRLGDDIGAVPGDTFDKTRTKAHSIVDNLREVLKITNNVKIEKFNEYVEGILATYCTFTPLAEIGGRSLARSFIICDEFQDMNRQQARAVMTRIGEGSKLVILGDLGQINNPRLTPTSCGLAYAIKHLAGKPEIAFISIGADETTRSPAAKALAKYL